MQFLKMVIVFSVALSFTNFGVGASETLSTKMDVGEITTQPVGHYHYCNRYSQDCKIRSVDESPMTLTKELWLELMQVNVSVNKSVNSTTDFEAYGTEEYWEYPSKDNNGDCEDFALLKRYLLMQRGWPASTLLMTVGRMKDGEGQAVLTVRTNMGDYILDNLNDKILLWKETPYKYLKRQSTKHSGHWVTVIDNRN